MNRRLRELHLFAGAGGGILGGILLGHEPVCAVELEEYPRRVLLQRQRDGILPWFPVWDDVRTFDGKPWRGRVDLIAGGFPCQDISAAGKGAGIDGDRSGLWSEFARIIGEVGPRYVFVENSPMLVGRGLGRVLGDLASLGFDAEWGVLGADDAGAPHIRKRIWILAHTSQIGWGWGHQEPGPRNNCLQPPGLVGRTGPWETTPEQAASVLGVGDGLAPELDEIKSRIGCCGNGQVPIVAAMAWQILSARMAGGVAA